MTDKLIDTHCHLDCDWFDNDREQVINRAREVGLTRLLNPGITLESSEKAISLANKFPEVFAAVGVHPNDGLVWHEQSSAHLQEMIAHPKVVAIGEIGLDYYRDRTPKDLQKHIFTEQLNLAAEENLPVVIHCREAMGDMIDILTEWKRNISPEKTQLSKFPGVLHSFSGDLADAKKILDLNFFIGITGPVTFGKSVELVYPDTMALSYESTAIPQQ